MADENESPTNLPVPDPLVSRVLGECPFPTDDPYYPAWLAFGRILVEKEIRLRSEFLERGTKASLAEHGQILADWLLAQFDLIGSTYTEICPNYEVAYLVADMFSTATDRTLEQFKSMTTGKPHLTRQGEYGGLKIRLAQRSLHWTAEALKRAREAENRPASTPLAEGAAPPEAPTPTSGTERTAPKQEQSIIGRNIDRLRKECGWSFDELTKVTGVDKRSILRHVHEDIRPYPATLKSYADAFSERLGRPVTPNDLEV